MKLQNGQNHRALIISDEQGTRLWLSSATGVFRGFANYVWPDRLLTDNERRDLLENPWQIFDGRKAAPNVQANLPPETKPGD